MYLFDAIKEYEQFCKVKYKKATANGVVRDLNILAVYLKNPETEEMSADHIVEYLNLLSQAGYKPNGVYKKVMTFKSFFDYLYKKGYSSIEKDTIPTPQREFSKPRIATREEYLQILKVINKAIKNKARKTIHVRNRAIANLLWDTGARIGEIVSLDLEDIKNRSASIQTEKTRGRIPYRRIFWSKETHTSILTWLKYRTRYANKHTLQDKEALFIGTNGGAFGKRLSNHAFCITMRKYSKLAGIPTLNAHSFRHHKGRFIIEKGGSGVDVMNILGHARMESSRPYVRLFGKSLKNKAQKFLD